LFEVIDMPNIVQQVQKRMLISLAQMSKSLDLKEGDHVMLEEKDGGIFIRPVAWHDKSQEYFWSKEWQGKVQSSLDDLKEGKFKTFDSIDDLLEDLDGDENA
jgi:hypothetical protein